MKLKLFFFLLVLSIAAVHISCTDEPSSIGIELIAGENISPKIYDTLVDSTNQSSSFFKRVIALGGSDWILVGKYQDITASTLMKFIFGLPDSIENDVKNGNLNVLDSWIILTPKYVYTDSFATHSFTVHKVNSYWSPGAFTIDSLSKLNYDAEDISSDFTISDSLYTFHINESLPLAWMKNSADKTLESNFGVYLNPSASSNKVMGFQAFTQISSDAAKLYVVIEKPGVYVDTINGFISSDVSIVDRPDLPVLPTGVISVQSSVSLNSKLSFSLDSIPVGIVINKAELYLIPDTINSVKGTRFTNSLRLYYLSSSDSIKTEGNPLFLSFSNNKYSGDITSFVRTWISRKENYGLLIEAGTPTNGLEFFVLKGSDFSETSERPRLRITYTVK